MTSNVLLVRCKHELSDELTDQLELAFPDAGELNFINVEPSTPEELLSLVQEYKAIAVLLRENPLPLLAMELVPCIPLRPDQPLQKLASLKTDLVDL